jgi:hypothetical protein
VRTSGIPELKMRLGGLSFKNSIEKDTKLVIINFDRYFFIILFRGAQRWLTLPICQILQSVRPESVNITSSVNLCRNSLYNAAKGQPNIITSSPAAWSRPARKKTMSDFSRHGIQPKRKVKIVFHSWPLSYLIIMATVTMTNPVAGRRN